MRTRANTDIRTMIKESGACLWEIAALVDISPNTLNLWMHKPLEGERRERVLAAIEKYKTEN